MTATRRSTGGSPTAILNTCANALDRHVAAGRGDQAAIDLRQPRHRHLARYTYASCSEHRPLRRRAAPTSAWQAGDRVVVYMPMVPEAVIAMLACARLGAVHSVVFGGFAPSSWRHASTTPSPRCRDGVVRNRAVRVVAYKPLLDEALGAPQHPPRRLRDPAAPQARRDSGAATSTGTN
jgi:propionyl-CoA synthetase